MVNKLAKRCYPLLQLLFHSEKSVVCKTSQGKWRGVSQLRVYISHTDTMNGAKYFSFKRSNKTFFFMNTCDQNHFDHHFGHHRADLPAVEQGIASIG